MKKFLSLIILFTLGIIVVGCDVKKDEDKEPDPGEVLDDYSELYEEEKTEKYPLLTGKQTYKAHHGYILNEEQGYNHWFYQVLVDDEFIDMTYDSTNAYFSYDEAILNQNIMMPSVDHKVVRKFVAPIQGRVTVSGKYSMAEVSEFDVTVSLKLNGETIDITSLSSDLKGSDLEGYYHQDVLDLNQGDSLYFIVETKDGSGQKVSWNPTVDYLEQIETSLHYNHKGEYIGDVHPFYENNQMYMFYLKTGGSWKTELLISKNMITYEPTPLYLDDTNPPEISNYYALGVYKDQHSGVYRSYFGMHNAMGSSKSNDLIHWSGGYSVTSDFLTGYKAYHPYETFPSGGRDPYVFYDPDIDRYRLVALYYHTNTQQLKDSAIGMLTSKTNTGETWETNAFELRRYPNAQAGEPEVPQMMKIGRRWYLLASETGITTHHVGGPSYWIGDLDTPIDQQDWSKKEKHVLDGEDLAAAQFVQIKDKYYLYGWLPQTYNQGNWGGYINIAHEVFQRADGTLGVRLDTHMQKILNRGKIYQYEPGAVGILQGTFNQNENSIVSTGSNVNELLFSGTYQRSLVDAKIKFELGASYAGVVIKQNSKTYEVIVSRENGSTYISIQNLMDLYHPISSKIRIGDDQMVDINLKLVIDRSNLELFINNEFALVGRTSLIGPSVELGLIAKGSGVEFSQVYVSKLASTENIFDK